MNSRRAVPEIERISTSGLSQSRVDSLTRERVWFTAFGGLREIAFSVHGVMAPGSRALRPQPSHGLELNQRKQLIAARSFGVRYGKQLDWKVDKAEDLRFARRFNIRQSVVDEPSSREGARESALEGKYDVSTGSRRRT
ncbi:hypothetical protein C8F04DRAFT_1186901 [Mycena alexandri]|uniref:Uncharacterized protein n=1 Tax=Mycena alexandri TaxID=1745969 RepID=A0AAD6SMN8_9AGAR|nr:hypothetical protein C8F04DRAFT_1186901 [Mycena alexandri]